MRGWDAAVELLIKLPATNKGLKGEFHQKFKLVWLFFMHIWEQGINLDLNKQTRQKVKIDHLLPGINV